MLHNFILNFHSAVHPQVKQKVAEVVNNTFARVDYIKMQHEYFEDMLQKLRAVPGSKLEAPVKVKGCTGQGRGGGAHWEKQWSYRVTGGIDGVTGDVNGVTGGDNSSSSIEGISRISISNSVPILLM